MKAVVINRYGSADVLEYKEVEKPIPAADQVLVKVMASSVNPVDWKIRQGDLQLLSSFGGFPRLGCDFAGVVEAIGNEVKSFKVGDEVYGLANPLSGGAYAEYITISESSMALKPNQATFEQAAAIPVAGLTAFQSLIELGQLQPGYQVLVNGASGGVGTFAVQIAKALYAEVTGVCSGKNREFVLGLGADFVIDYHQEDFTKQVKQYDLILDAVGKSSFQKCQPVLKPQGIYISTLPSVDTFLAIGQTFFFSGQKAKIVLAQPRRQDLNGLSQLIDQSKVKVIIDRVYPLSEIAEAHRYSETGRAVGKIVLSVP
ncbi:Alcohol dehydrogenase zinc-binding domain protein [Gloeothece citriformis PCC 7424]|uniref:Alcohol dehydrogenase zinc-binding domain protein n=1 Tax=Gloeothece citriformis (strain PCC 7424) TaxID=65393 RepID=B7K939_GLOC7|nr:NAD(P)-dependent alcohol dehydrogenase [Gloeothece citriformis]ACK72808.1 Alcohol dehydrogenase zinc-binding domain protein [Gloeothece citriformis PCC 7424]